MVALLYHYYAGHCTLNEVYPVHVTFGSWFYSRL